MEAVFARAAARAALDTLVVQAFWSLPALTVPLAIGVAACRPRAARWLALACLGLLLVLGGCIALRISLLTPRADLVAAVIAVVAYHLLAALSWTVRPPWLRVLAMGTAYAPIMAAWAVFLVFQRMVVPGALLLIGGYVHPPVEQATLPGGLICQVNTRGSAISLGGRAVHLYDHPLGLPFLRREVLRVTEKEPDSDSVANPEPERASCRSAFADYALHHPGQVAGPG